MTHRRALPLLMAAGLGLTIAAEGRAQRWSPDGDWLAYVVRTGAPDARDERQLAWLLGRPEPTSPADSGTPRREILWASDVASGEAVALDSVEGELTEAAWAPGGASMVHGRLIADPAGTGLQFEILRQPDTDGGTRRLGLWPWGRGESLGEDERRGVTWSADGEWLVIPRPDGPGLRILEPDTGRLVRDLAGASRPSWSPAGHVLAYLAGSDPQRLMILEAPDGEPLVLGALAGSVVGDLPSPCWDREGRRVAVLTSLGGGNGPADLRLEWFAVDPPGPEPSVPVPTTANLSGPGLQASMARVEANGDLFVTARTARSSEVLSWYLSDRGEVYKRFHPLLEGVPIHAVAICPRPGRLTLALDLGAEPRRRPPALCDPVDETLTPLVPDETARSAWRALIRASIGAVFDEAARPVPGVREASFAVGPTRLPLPGALRTDDPAMKRWRRLARLGEALRTASEGEFPAGEELGLSPVDRLLYEVGQGRPAAAESSVAALEAIADDEEARGRLLGLRAQLAFAAGDSARAAGIQAYLTEAGPTGGWLLNDAGAGRVGVGDPFPMPPPWLEGLRKSLSGEMKPAGDEAEVVPGFSVIERLQRFEVVEEEPAPAARVPRPPRPAPARPVPPR